MCCKMFNFINSKEKNYFLTGYKYNVAKAAGKINLSSNSVKNMLKGNNKKIFRKNINSDAKFGLLHKRSKAKNNIFLIRSFIWFKFRSHNKRVIRKKFLVRKKRQFMAEKIFLKKGNFKLKNALYFSYIGGRVSKILTSIQFNLVTR